MVRSQIMYDSFIEYGAGTPESVSLGPQWSEVSECGLLLVSAKLYRSVFFPNYVRTVLREIFLVLGPLASPSSGKNL